MGNFDRRTQAKLDRILERSCRKLLHGGDHETRRYVAERLIEAELSGKTQQADFYGVAQRALLELDNRKSANSQPSAADFGNMRAAPT
jgi:hypothetical protein